MTTLANEPKASPSRPARTAAESGFMGFRSLPLPAPPGRAAVHRRGGGGTARVPRPTIPVSPCWGLPAGPGRTERGRAGIGRTGAVRGPGADVVLDPEAGTGGRERRPGPLAGVGPP